MASATPTIQIIELFDGFAPIGSGGTGTFDFTAITGASSGAGGLTFGKGAAKLAGTGIPGSGTLSAS